ncbi:hypothetical protein C8C85_1471 [Flavobacterium sp. 103]|uniref:hypothetical protein n=1 Tax=Flavobacterium sp. 103 TaxID=2135624 RepID=UPI000D5E5999|nr:hypothetical protein [Flavobacterium sp. 103]PVX45670.1 hypothetical protein C8C85_1471 [Flavobacterium sp. 103]
MKTSIVLIFMIILPITFGFETLTNDTVYICKGPYSKKYHYDKNCRGLSNCSTEIYSVSKKESQNSGRTLCGLED